uniref:Uncharacterized protein n=1 Tax=Triticum urartu TaxID=4572 RepID=A0A8R7V7V2_TRIUA
HAISQSNCISSSHTLPRVPPYLRALVHSRSGRTTTHSSAAPDEVNSYRTQQSTTMSHFSKIIKLCRRR